MLEVIVQRDTKVLVVFCVGEIYNKYIYFNYYYLIVIKCNAIKCTACNDCGNFNIWKDTMAKLLLYLFKLIFFSWIYGWPEEWNLFHTLENYELYHPLINTRGVTIHLAHEMRQNTDTWFTRTRQMSNLIFFSNINRPKWKPGFSMTI